MRLASLGVFVSTAAMACAAPASHASEATVFLATAEPKESWAAGLGGAFSVSFFSILHLEGEGARLPGESPEAALYTFTGAALVAPPTGRIVPYAGLGVGLFRQELGSRSDTGTLRALVAGLKWKLGPVFVVKAEWRHLDLSGEPLIPVDNRYSLGAGLSF